MPTKAIVPNHKAVITHARFSLMVLILSLTHTNNTGILAYLHFKGNVGYIILLWLYYSSVHLGRIPLWLWLATPAARLSVLWCGGGVFGLEAEHSSSTHL